MEYTEVFPLPSVCLDCEERKLCPSFISHLAISARFCYSFPGQFETILSLKKTMENH